MSDESFIKEGLRQMPIRPVYLASMEHEGKRNIITIGMFAFFSSKPSLVGIGIAPSRYSFALIRDSKAFIVNVVDENLLKAVKICGEESGRNVDKFRLAGLTAESASKVAAPLIKESPVCVECRVVQEIQIGDHVWFIGEVLAVRVRHGYDWKNGLLFKWIGEDGVFHKVGEKIAEY